jgi:hypothetical protein
MFLNSDIIMFSIKSGKMFVIIGREILALCNFPKAVEAVTEATSKPLRVLDLALQDSERDLSV